MREPDDDPHPDATPLDDEAVAWVMRFVDGKATRASLEALQQWAARSPDHVAAFDRVSRAWQGLGPLGRQLVAEGAVATAGTRRPAAIRRRAFIGGALAASAAALVVRPPLGLWPSWSELGADYRTAVGEQRSVDLPAQVSVTLNTRTSIAVGASGDEIRLIAGEAMVAVMAARETPFVLATADGRVAAARARFNARTVERGTCVTCIEGEVRVVLGGAVLSLPAGRQATFSDQEIGPAAAVDSGMVTAWREGIVIFQSTPVRDVVIEINRYRSGRVILTSEALGKRLFNARLRIEHIGRVVPQIAQVFGAEVTELPGGIVLLG
jgi:transmembrane sensor